MKEKMILTAFITRWLVAAPSIYMLFAVPAHAGGTLSFGQDQSIGIGMEMRASYTSTGNAAPGVNRTSVLDMDNISLKLSASLNKNIKAFLSTDRNPAGDFKFKDAYVRVDLEPELNLIAGRVLPPTDRANLAGAYYALAWSFPRVASKYPSAAFGRDDGLAVWGKLLDKKVVYSVGAFKGRNSTGSAASNQNANPLFAGRVAINFRDAEPAPLYFTGSTYYGAANILTIGLVALAQKDGVGNLAVKDDYRAWNIDALLEQPLGASVITIDGAYYRYSFSPAAATVDGRVVPGNALMLGGGFLFGEKIGNGKLQPYYRHQQFDARNTGIRTQQSDFGLNYIMDGSRAKVSGTYTRSKVAAIEIDAFVLGFQLQF